MNRTLKRDIDESFLAWDSVWKSVYIRRSISYTAWQHENSQQVLAMACTTGNKMWERI